MKHRLLEKELGLWDVYALATGATLSSGLFLLPGIAAAGAGPAMPLSYLLGALVLLPGLACKIELATAMPRSGGIYFFLDRSLGPLVGMIGGFGTWIALLLKSAFALIGISAYLLLFAPTLPTGPIAAGFAIFFGILNYFGAKKSGSFQVFLLAGLLILLGWFCGIGIFEIEIGHYAGFFRSGGSGIVGTAGLVVISYMGLTKVASVAEEVKNPERNLPLGLFLAFGTIVTVYVVGTSIMVGVVGVDRLAANGGDMTPVATVAEALVGRWGAIVMTVAAVLAFSSVANAGILGASRYPLAMGRDKMLPERFSKIGKQGTPTFGIVLTVGLILLSVLLFDPTKIAKLASAFKMIMFALACLAVIVMRESRIASYDPGYQSPLYPVGHIAGIIAPVWLIVKMGPLPMLFTGGLILFGILWYWFYARGRVVREGAIFHIFQRLGRGHTESPAQNSQDDGSDASENLPGDTKARDAASLRKLIDRADVIDVPGPIQFADLAETAATRLALHLPARARRLADGFIGSTQAGATAISRGTALSHIRMDSLDHAHIVMARVRDGVVMTDESTAPDMAPRDVGSGQPSIESSTRAVFFLVSPQDNPAFHLRILAMIARRVGREHFMQEWLGASGAAGLKRLLYREEHPAGV